MTRRDARRLLEAHDAIWNAWWPTLRDVPKSLAHRRTTGSFPNLFATTRHMVDAELYWQERMETGSSFGTVASCRAMAQVETPWQTLQKHRRMWVGTADLRGAVEFEAAGGYTACVSTWECLMHVITHAHFHRGQLVSQCRELGLQPPSRHLLGKFFDEF
jgi:uncharacterized damage-inducible protein DinB